MPPRPFLNAMKRSLGVGGFAGVR
jgi:hypothetical protein